MVIIPNKLRESLKRLFGIKVNTMSLVSETPYYFENQLNCF